MLLVSLPWKGCWDFQRLDIGGRDPGTQNWNCPFIFKTSMFITVIPPSWPTAAKVTALKHILSHWQIISGILQLKGKCNSVQHRVNTPWLNIWISGWQQKKTHTSCSAGYLLLDYFWLLQRKIKDTLTPPQETLSIKYVLISCLIYLSSVRTIVWI